MGDGKIKSETALHATSNVSIDDLRRRWNIDVMRQHSEQCIEQQCYIPYFNLSNRNDLKLFYDDSAGGKYMLCTSYTISIEQIIQNI